MLEGVKALLETLYDALQLFILTYAIAKGFSLAYFTTKYDKKLDYDMQVMLFQKELFKEGEENAKQETEDESLCESSTKSDKA